MTTRVATKTNTKTSLFQPNFQADFLTVASRWSWSSQTGCERRIVAPTAAPRPCRASGRTGLCQQYLQCIEIDIIAFFLKLNLITGKKQYFCSFFFP